MFGIVLSAFMLGFGIFLKITQHPGFAKNKKLAWVFIVVGTLSLVFKILNYK